MSVKRQVGLVKHVSPRTIRVQVERLTRHRLYGKPYRLTRSILADVPPGQTLAIGDRVSIEATRPLSKRKAWRLVAVLESASAQVGDTAALGEEQR